MREPSRMSSLTAEPLFRSRGQTQWRADGFVDARVAVIEEDLLLF